MHTTTIIFDLDGTLADSSSCIVAAAQSTRETLNLRSIQDDAVRAKIGQPLRGMLGDLFDVDGSILDDAVQEYSKEYVRLAESKETLFKGTLPMLRILRRAGFRMGIATGKSQRGADRATARLGLRSWFDSIHGILPGTPGKPDPAVLVRAMEALGESADHCVMVGDTTFDLDLAHAVGVRTVGVSWGVHPLQLLRSRNPAFLASDFHTLQEWLLSQRS